MQQFATGEAPEDRGNSDLGPEGWLGLQRARQGRVPLVDLATRGRAWKGRTNVPAQEEDQSQPGKGRKGVSVPHPDEM